MKCLTSCLALVAALLPMSSLSVMAEDRALPVTKQATVFRQIFHYDERLSDSVEIFVILLGSEEDTASMDELAQAFDKIDVSVKALNITELAAPVDPATVVYVLPGSDLSSIKRFCTENEILSISGNPSMAENGDVSIGLGNKGGSPEIFVNRARLKAEKHKLSSHLLRLATLIE